ncbi:unnamed protein product [Cunninghamella echinulata]
MGKKTANTKAEAAKEKKAANKNEKDRAKQTQLEADEADKWSQGAKKNKKADNAEKKAAAAAKKAEAAKLLAEEEKELAQSKPKLSGADKKAGKKSAKIAQETVARRTIPEFSASNIDDALDLLSLDDKLKAKDIEKHPERRFKAALAAFEERELPRFKQENPGLRLSQLKDLMYKAFQKSPDNPFNQANIIAYNATQEDAKELKANQRKGVEDRLRV